MYERKLALIDKVISIMLSKIYFSVAEKLSETEGVDELLPLLEHQFCSHLTKGESPDLEELQIDSDVESFQSATQKSVDVAKMLAFLDISCAEYLFLKELLKSIDIHDAYYDTRVLRYSIDGYNKYTCLQILSFVVEKLDSSIVEEQASRNRQKALRFLQSNDNVSEHIADIYAELFSRIQDETLKTNNSGVKQSVILPHLGPVSASNVPLEGVEVTHATNKMLLLFPSLHQNCKIFDSYPDDTQEFVKNLFKLIKIAQEGLMVESTEPSEKSEARSEAYRHVIAKAEQILRVVSG